jgi:hypothetical protein
MLNSTRRRALVATLALFGLAQMIPAQEPARRQARRQPVTPELELERTAFRDDRARMLLERARAARGAQDAALGAYDANTYMRMSVGLGVRRLGAEKLLFRTELAARVQWARATGLWVQPTGRRTVFPMGQAEVDFAPATPIPFFPGRESLWFPGGGGLTEVEVDENELLHPLALGAEAYYRYATGDSAAIRLSDGRVIALRELRITARRPEWRSFVGSFWFDVDRGSLVRAAYRMAAEMDVWQMASEEARREIEELEAKARADSGAAVDSLRREIQEVRRDQKDERIPRLLFRPMRANISAITVEYGLHQGRFWLPRLNVAEGEIVATIMRVPMRVEERFSYRSVTIDTGGVISATAAAQSDTTSAAYLAQRDTGYVSGGYATMNVGAGEGSRRAAQDQDSLYRALIVRADSLRAVADSAKAKGDTSRAAGLTWRANNAAGRARAIARRKEGCARDSTYYAGSTTRHDGALRIAIRMPCDTSRFATSPDLPQSIFDQGEQVFGASERDELLDALDMDLQPGWLPQPPVLQFGLDLIRYNRIEGLSIGAAATSTLGRGYTARVEARLGTADLIPNGEVSIARSNGRDELGLAAFHRLGVANDDFGAPLSFGASLGNLIDAGDEGFYYRSWGAELSGTRRAPLFGVPVEWRVFAERQRSAGVEANTQVSLGNLFANPRFVTNIDAAALTALGTRLAVARSFGVNPRAARFDARLRLEGAAMDRQDIDGMAGYGRYVTDATLSFPFGPFRPALNAAVGTSSGDLPVQRAFFVGGLHTVRGQVAQLGGEGRVGDAFWLSRTDLGLTRSLAFKPTLFYDIGWAGSRRDITRVGRPLSGAGFGVSLLDGLLRLDLARGIWPEQRWRLDFQVGSPF